MCERDIEIQEWGKRTLCRELATDEVFLKGLSHLSDKKILKIESFDGVVVIKARSYVGLFDLKDSNGKDHIIKVKPRINVNLVWMIAISENFKKVKEIENLISVLSESQSDTGLPIISVVRGYLKRLNEALTYGFLEMSKTEVEEGTVIRGRIVGSLLPKTLFQVLHRELHMKLNTALLITLLTNIYWMPVICFTLELMSCSKLWAKIQALYIRLCLSLVTAHFY